MKVTIGLFFFILVDIVLISLGNHDKVDSWRASYENY